MQTIEYMNSEEIKQLISDNDVSDIKIHKYVIKKADKVIGAACFIDIDYYTKESSQKAIRESVYDMFTCKKKCDNKGIDIAEDVTLYTKLIKEKMTAI